MHVMLFEDEKKPPDYPEHLSGRLCFLSSEGSLESSTLWFPVGFSVAGGQMAQLSFLVVALAGAGFRVEAGVRAL